MPKKQAKKFNIEKSEIFINFYKNLFSKIEYSAEKYALKITLIYFIIGCLWILVSDKLVELFIYDIASATIINILKGWIYVFFTALLIFFLVFSALKKFLEAKDELEELNCELEKKVFERTSQLESINCELEEEIVERQNAEKEISKLNNDLESKVIERTNELQKINTMLKEEISERKKAEDTLKNSEEKYRLLAEFASDVIWVLNLSTLKFTYCSPSVIRLTGFTVEETLTRKFEEIFTPESLILAKKTISTHTEKFLNDPVNPSLNITEFQQTTKNGDLIWVEVSSRYRFNSDGDIEIVGVSRNINQRKMAENEVLYLSNHDQLTGLYNRRYYQQEIQRFDEEKFLPLTLVMADVNGLKLTNDAFGHKAGDIILMKISNVLKRECRSSDVVARIGGDEFIILLPNTDEKTVSIIIERMNRAIENENVENVILSVSMGFSVKNNKSDDIDEVFKKAEDDMYRHKLSQSSSMRSKTIDLIVSTLYEKSNREMLHSKNVSQICVDIANGMGFGEDDINQIRIAGLMHDIGKIAIDEKILNKPKELSFDEWHEVKKHSEIGYRILSSVNEFSEIADCVLEHHERWDGTGYPRGLKGEEISLRSRIIAVADAYDAITTDRPYRQTLSYEEAIDEITNHSGMQFDPDIVDIFIKKVLKKI